MKQDRRAKPDKWRNLLKEAVALKEQKEQQYNELQQQQEVLKARHCVLEQILHGMSAMSSMLAASQGAASCEQLQDLEAVIGGCLGFVQDGGTTACRTAAVPCVLKPTSLQFLQAVHNPQHVQQVLAMSDEEVRHKLARCIGKTAILLVQDNTDATWQQQQQQQHTEQQHKEQQQQQEQEQGHSLLGGSSDSLELSACLPDPALLPQPSCHSAWLVRDSIAAGGTTSNGSSGHLNNKDGSSWHGPDAAALGPAYEYASMLSTLFEFDEQRFLRLASCSLETGGPLALPEQPAFGLALGQQLQLSAAQIATFRAARDVVQVPHEALPRSIATAAGQQEALAAQQEQHVRSAHAAPHAFPGTADALHEAHAAALEQQQAALGTFRMLGRFTGLVTLNTLTSWQMAKLVTCCWPCIPRIEPVLDVLDDLVPVPEAAAGAQPQMPLPQQQEQQQP